MATSPFEDSTNIINKPQESTIVVVEGAEDRDIPSPFPFPLHYPTAIKVGLKLKDLTTITRQLLYQDSKCDATL